LSAAIRELARPVTKTFEMGGGGVVPESSIVLEGVVECERKYQ